MTGVEKILTEQCPTTITIIRLLQRIIREGNHPNIDENENFLGCIHIITVVLDGSLSASLSVRLLTWNLGVFTDQEIRRDSVSEFRNSEY